MVLITPFQCSLEPIRTIEFIDIETTLSALASQRAQNPLKYATKIKTHLNDLRVWFEHDLLEKNFLGIRGGLVKLGELLS